MGLDSHFRKAHKDAITTEVDFKVDNRQFLVTDVAYFRKNSALHGWMQELYRSKGGVDLEFNCSSARLRLRILQQLVLHLIANTGPKPQAFDIRYDVRAMK